MMTRQSLLELIDATLDGAISEADFLRLEAQLHVDAEARQLYYDRLKLHTALGEEKAASLSPQPAARPTRRLLPLTGSLLFGGLTILLLATAIWLAKAPEPALPEMASSEPTAEGFGVVIDSIDAHWASTSYSHGQLIAGEKLSLQSGIAHIELFSGVALVLEGGADFQLHSDMEMTLHTGRLRATVPPPARGFRVRTSTGDVVDLGTEFAIDARAERADVHVLDGEVEWHPTTADTHQLRDGQSLGWTRDGVVQPTSVASEFTGLEHLSAERSQRQQRWQEYSQQQLCKDSRLLAYFPIADRPSHRRQLRDTSAAGRHGTIVRAQPATDRWGGDQALSFSPTGSRVRMEVPGSHSALTLSCWVRIDSLDRWYNSLFLTDGHELGEPHWQIMDDGRLFFSVKRRTATKDLSDKQIAYSPPIWTPALSGQWQHIATSYDSQTGQITHYRDGLPISQEQLTDDYIVDQINIGTASIGNWSDPMRADPHFAVRNLNGAIDDFALYSTALTSEEIKQIYELGRP